MMKMKYLSPLIAVAILSLTAAGCSPKKDDLKDNFDAAAYTQALLDARIHGNTAKYTELSGESADALTALFDEELQNLVTLSIGDTATEPGSQVLSPQLSQDYSDLWKQILESTKYKATKAEKENDSYAVTVETQMMNLNTPVNDLLTEKLTEYYADAPQEEVNSTEIYLQLMLESYQEVLSDLTYEDAEETTITLSKKSEKVWTISDEDLQIIKDHLFTPSLYVADDNGTVSAEYPEDIQTEATPDQTYPENIGQAPSHALGETFTLSQDGKDMVEFSIDSVEITDERSQYDPSNPEKVVVVTYTYKNLGHEDPVLYDQMSFQVLEGETTCSPYYLQTLTSADIASKGGQAVTASLAYGVSASCNEITIYVDNSQILSPFKVTVPLA